MTRSRFAEKEHKLMIRLNKDRLFEFYTWLAGLPLAVAAVPAYGISNGYDMTVSSDDPSLLIMVKLTWGGE